MAKITTPDKSTGEQRTAAEDNHVKQVINENADALFSQNGGAFTGELSLKSIGGTYYNTYDLGASGSLTFSESAEGIVFGSAYLTIVSDGVTELASKANLDAIFNEQYGIPANRILDEGVHKIYVLKTPTGLAINLPVNNYVIDVVAPTVTSATIENANPDQLVVVFNETVNITNVTGLSLDGDLSALTIDSVISGSGTNTLTFQLSGSASIGESGNFVYGATNTIEDLVGNDLASSTMSLTNNIVGNQEAIAFTLENYTYDSENNIYTKSAGTGYPGSYATSVNSYTGPFIFEIEANAASCEEVMFAISTVGTNRPFNDATPWQYGLFSAAGNVSRAIIDGVSTETTPEVTFNFAANDKFSIRRDANNIVKLYYNETVIATRDNPLVGAVYFHFSNKDAGDIIKNPLLSQ